MTTRPSLRDALIGGAIGATTLTLIHEIARRIIPGAPRVDTLGRRALAIGLESVGVDPPGYETLQAVALAGDIATNTLYYALAGLGPREGATLRGAIWGAIGGVGTAVLPPLVGLGHREAAGTPARTAMTIAWYLAGGIAAGAAIEGMGRP